MTVGIHSRNCGNGFSLLKKFCAPTDAFLCVSRRTFVQQLLHKSATVGEIFFNGGFEMIFRWIRKFPF